MYIGAEPTESVNKILYLKEYFRSKNNKVFKHRTIYKKKDSKFAQTLKSYHYN